MGTTTESQMKSNPLTPKHGDIFYKQPDHALAIAIFSCGVSPKSRKILRQGEDRRSLLVIEDPAVRLAVLLIVLLSFLECPQFLIPVRFQ